MLKVCAWCDREMDSGGIDHASNPFPLTSHGMCKWCFDKWCKDELVFSLRGFPSCPLCHKQLSHRQFPDIGESHWHCKPCGVEWPVGDLIRAMNYEEDTSG